MEPPQPKEIPEEGGTRVFSFTVDLDGGLISSDSMMAADWAQLECALAEARLESDINKASEGRLTSSDSVTDSDLVHREYAFVEAHLDSDVSREASEENSEPLIRKLLLAIEENEEMIECQKKVIGSLDAELKDANEKLACSQAEARNLEDSFKALKVACDHFQLMLQEQSQEREAQKLRTNAALRANVQLSNENRSLQGQLLAQQEECKNLIKENLRLNGVLQDGLNRIGTKV